MIIFTCIYILISIIFCRVLQIVWPFVEDESWYINECGDVVEDDEGSHQFRIWSLAFFWPITLVATIIVMIVHKEIAKEAFVELINVLREDREES